MRRTARPLGTGREEVDRDVLVLGCPRLAAVIGAEGAPRRDTRRTCAGRRCGSSWIEWQRKTAPGRGPAVPRRVLENPAIRLPGLAAVVGAGQEGRVAPEIQASQAPRASLARRAMWRSPSAQTPLAGRSAATASRSCHRPWSAGPSGRRPCDSRPRRGCRRARRRSRGTRPSPRGGGPRPASCRALVRPEQEEPLTCTDQRQDSHSVASLTSVCADGEEASPTRPPPTPSSAAVNPSPLSE